jgi:hypothetical protein
MSEKTAATTASGQEPKKPAKKRQMRIVWISLAVAVAIVKREKPKMDRTMGKRRPFNSDNGAHNEGPNAKPKTYNEVPKTPTSRPTSNFLATVDVAEEKMEDVKVATTVV